MPTCRMHSSVLALVAAGLTLATGSSAPGVGSSSAHAGAESQLAPTRLDSPFTAFQQTALAFGDRSHWLQPWRGYVDTVPVRRFLQGTGINFNVHPGSARFVARLLARAGFRRARYEIGWCSIAYDEPARIADRRQIRTVLRALRDNGLRPLILLNAHHGCPGPLRGLEVQVAAHARAGDRSLELHPASADRVVPGLTGLDSLTTYKAAALIFTSVSGTKVTLSKPLEHDLAPGIYPASILRYEPFRRPGDAGFERTLRGWLAYVGAVAREVRALLGRDSFDVEIWNELTFGSDFLDINRYYSPAIAAGNQRATEDALLRRTISFLRRAGSGVRRVGIGNGFSNQRPWEAGSTSPVGLTAIDKHPYAERKKFPEDAVFNGIRPLDALGRPAGTLDAGGHWLDDFIPRYVAFFPEYYLNAIQTEHLIRDMSPITTEVYGTPHGRHTRPLGGRPPKLWVTETGLDPNGVPPAVLPRFKAKATLRYLTSWINKGAAAVYLFAAGNADGPWALVDERAASGGPALRALRRLTGALRAGRKRITRRRAITLVAVADKHGRKQFRGDGTKAHPPLYDRDILAFFPFQVSNRRAAVALYVMTRDLLKPYRRALPVRDPNRYDLPPERFRLTIAGVRGLDRRIRARDPMTGKRVSVRVVRRGSKRLVIDIRLTDAPRLLLLG